MARKKSSGKTFSHRKSSPKLQGGKHPWLQQNEWWARGKCQEMRLGEEAGGRPDRNLCIALSIWNFNLYSMHSIEWCLGGRTCAFKLLLWLLCGKRHGEGRSGNETHLGSNCPWGKGWGSVAWTRGSSGDRDKWMDLRESFWKCISTLGNTLGVGSREKEVLRMTHKFLAPATGWIVDNLY